MLLGVYVLALTGLLIGGPATLWYRARYNAWPGQSLPDRLAWCGRSYDRSGPPVAVRDLLPQLHGAIDRQLTVVSTYRLPLGLPHDVVVMGEVDQRWSCAGQRSAGVTMTFVFVREGSRYVDYTLSGGP